MTDPMRSYPPDQGYPAPIADLQVTDVSPSKKDRPIIIAARKAARLLASDDIADLRDLIESAGFVYIERTNVEKLAAQRARKYARSVCDQPGSDIDDTMYQAIQATYRLAYLEYFDAHAQEPGANGTVILESSLIVRLREAAREDRRIREARGKPYHIRDIGVMRVLIELNITPHEALERLSEIHELADKYDKFYSDPREGATWPTGQQTF